MNLELKPELARYLESQVEAGRYSDLHAAANDAIARAMAADEWPADDLDEEDARAIEDGLAQLDRGEGLSWPEIRARLEARTRPR